jgi:ABC-type phosphate transport system auxiliary subunit
MPVTAKLSQKFYEKFGDDLTNELVNWLNQVDATYRSDLRELNEVNFARFDAKVEQRAAQLDAKVEQRAAQLDAKLEQRIAEVKAELRQESAELRSEFRSGLAGVEGRLLARIGVLEGRFGTLEGRLVRWMFLFWVGQAVTTVGLVFGVVRLLDR